MRRAAGWVLLGAGCLAVLGGPRAASAQDGQPPADRAPVLVVPGWFDTAEHLAGLRVRLRAAGWPVAFLAGVTFADPTGSNRDHAEEIHRAVELLKERTGRDTVDIIAHSMGGLATRMYLREHPGSVRRVVFLATPHHGTLAAYLAFGAGREEMLPGSDFLEDLNSGSPLPEGVEGLTIRTRMETHIIPRESATLPGVPDYEVCCATHESLTRDLNVFEVMRDFLLEGRTP